MEREVKRVLLYGDGDLALDTNGFTIFKDGEAVFCDFSEAGVHVASGYLRDGGGGLETLKLFDVLAENPFAPIVAPGCDRMARLVKEANTKTAVELLDYLLHPDP